MAEHSEEIRAPGQPVDKCPRCGQQSSPGCPFCEMVASFARVLPSPPAPYYEDDPQTSRDTREAPMSDRTEDFDEAWIRVTLPSGWEDEAWDMVMAAAEMLSIAVHALDPRAQAEHLNHAEVSVLFGSPVDETP